MVSDLDRTTQEFLDREVFLIPEAARLLKINSGKLRRWLEGYMVQGKRYDPVLRVEPTGSELVRWGEFVDAGLLAQYRKRQVTLQRLRPFIDALRQDFNAVYPLAEFRPAVDAVARDLVLEAQERVQLDPHLQIIRRYGEPGAWQLRWEEPMRKFLEHVEYDPTGLALAYAPMTKTSPVRIDPEEQFGIPQVRGVRTETVAEAYAEYASEERTADALQLDIEAVRAAIQWELEAA